MPTHYRPRIEHSHYSIAHSKEHHITRSHRKSKPSRKHYLIQLHISSLIISHGDQILGVHTVTKSQSQSEAKDNLRTQTESKAQPKATLNFLYFHRFTSNTKLKFQ